MPENQNDVVWVDDIAKWIEDEAPIKTEHKHNHYYKDVRKLDFIDVYAVCELFEIDDKSGAIQHAIKKLLCSGKRGAKDKMKDIAEAKDTLERYLEMME